MSRLKLEWDKEGVNMESMPSCRKTIIDYMRVMQEYNSMAPILASLIINNNDEWIEFRHKTCELKGETFRNIDFNILLGYIFCNSTKNDFKSNLKKVLEDMCEEDLMYWYGSEEEADARTKQINLLLEHFNIK